MFLVAQRKPISHHNFLSFAQLKLKRAPNQKENINNFFAQELYIEEGFRKNKVSCVIATSDNKITIGFSEGIYSRPKTLLKGNMLNMSTNQIDLILS